MECRDFFSKLAPLFCRVFPKGKNKSSNVSVRYKTSSLQLNTSTSSSSVRSVHRRCEIRSVLRFLTFRNKSAANIHCQFVETYGSEVTTRKYVIKLFKKGRTDTHDEERSGRPSVISEELVAAGRRRSLQ